MADAPLTVGDRITLKREAKGWTKTELARRSQVDMAWISRLENGTRHRVSFEAIIRIADALGVSLNWLAGRGEEYPPFEVVLAGAFRLDALYPR